MWKNAGEPGRLPQAFEQAINHTSTEHAPWHIIPADHKWFMRAAVSEIIVNKLQSLNLRFPRVSEERQERPTTG